MKAKRIKLEKLLNTRDLGGYVGADGKILREKMLIRSGHLSHASDNDISVLVNDYNLKAVIDLRIDAEINEKPDKIPEGVEYIRIPLLDKAFLGITRDEYSLKSWFNLFEDKTKRPEDIFFTMYEFLVFGDRARELIPQVFSVFLKNNDAVLWHCSAGKDRVGVITMLLLLALGVDKETIISDYLATNKFSRREILKTQIFAPFVLRNRWYSKCLSVLMTVKREYMQRLLDRIDKDYEDIFDFFYSAYGIEKETIFELRKKYLE